MKIRFLVTPCSETGGYVARWDDPSGGGICTQGDCFADIEAMILDAVEGYFDGKDKPGSVSLHFLSDPELAVA